MSFRIVTTLAAAAAIASPALAQNAGDAPDRAQQQMSEASQQCLEQLREVDQTLADAGYGRVGPQGYANYGGVYGTGATAEGRSAAPTVGMARGGLTSPRNDMRTLMRAGYVLAATGNAEGCQAVAQSAQDIADRFEQAMQDGEMDSEALAEWRGEYLGSAVQVSSLERPMSVDEILGADVRNMRDEDLGDVDDVVMGPDGEIRYVLVSEGGFLGIGEEQVPVRWQDLKVTPAPYRDTLVLDVSEQTFEDAPRIQAADGMSLTGDTDADEQFQSYWEKAGLGDRAG